MSGIFLLRMLGFWHSLSKFIKANWRWVVPLIVAVILGIMIVRWYNHKIEESYQKGVSYEKALINQRIAEEDQRNRKFESDLQDIITKYGNNIAKQAADRVISENKQKDIITTIVKNNPIYNECKIDQEVIDRRNQIRQLGPTGDN